MKSNCEGESELRIEKRKVFIYLNVFYGIFKANEMTKLSNINTTNSRFFVVFLAFPHNFYSFPSYFEFINLQLLPLEKCPSIFFEVWRIHSWPLGTMSPFLWSFPLFFLLFGVFPVYFAIEIISNVCSRTWPRNNDSIYIFTPVAPRSRTYF